MYCCSADVFSFVAVAQEVEWVNWVKKLPMAVPLVCQCVWTADSKNMIRKCCVAHVEQVSTLYGFEGFIYHSQISMYVFVHCETAEWRDNFPYGDIQVYLSYQKPF